MLRSGFLLNILNLNIFIIIIYLNPKMKQAGLLNVVRSLLVLTSHNHVLMAAVCCLCRTS